MRKKYRYQFYEVSQDSTLVLENPSYIKFINIGQLPGGVGLGMIATINNVFQLSTFGNILQIQGGAFGFLNESQFPYELELKNEDDGIDVKQYKIKFSGTIGRLFVICKYYVK